MYRQHHDHHNQDLVQDSDPRDSIGAKSTDTICSATTAGLGQLPVDVLYEVLKSLSVRDIVRLQRVSKRFCEITHERIVWANAYHLTTLPRPSGPHAWQDATSLKCHLIRSAKVEKSWPRRHVAPASVLDGAGSATSHDANADGGGAATREYYPTSTRKFTCPISRPITLKTVAGRWVVICTRTAIWCIDMEAEEVPLESSSGDYVARAVEVYKCVDAALEFSFCLSTTDREGCVVVYVVAEERSHAEDDCPRSICLFKLNLPSEIGSENHMSARCTGRVPIGEATLFNAVLAHDLLIIHVVAIGHPHRFWLVHTPTDRLYQMQAGEGEPSWVSLHLCSTHIMMIWRRRHEATQTWECHIQAYPHPTLPIFSDIDTNSRAPANNNIPEIHLQLSHRGVCPVPMIFSGPALWDYEMERRTDGKTRSKGQGTRVLLIAYRTPPRLAAADLVLEPPPLSSSSCPSSYTTITTSSRSEPAAITCTLHDILVPTGSDSRRGLVPHFYTTSRGNESRGIIESSSSINRRDRDILGFTLSLDVQPDLTSETETDIKTETETQAGVSGLGKDQCTGTGRVKISFHAEKLTMPAATRPCLVVGFDGNMGRMVRRHPTEGKEILEIIDFA